MTRKPATYEDILALPDNLIGELLNGELIASPRPAFPHAKVVTELVGELTLPFSRGRGGPGGWWLLFEPEVHLGGDVLVPDMAGWRKSRMPAFPDVAFVTLAPDWICEVLSPSTSDIDLNRKLPIYAREQVAHAWIIDPRKKTLEVLGRDGERWKRLSMHAGEDKVRAEPFDAIEVELGAFWPPTAPKPTGAP